jgi:phosphoglycolate phosphatase-like HAD superfamily hydrolase
MIPTVKPRVIILDFDGVVIESNDVKTRAFIHVFSDFPEYFETMMAYHYTNIPLGRFYKFDHLLEIMGKAGDRELRNRIATAFTVKIQEEMQGVPYVAGALNFIKQFSARLPMYLASVTPAEELDIILDQRGLKTWFREIYGCPPWSKPEAIIDVLSREKVDADEALLIGDSAGDQRAAQKTGVAFLARDSGLDFDTPLPECFRDMNEITRYLEEILS